MNAAIAAIVVFLVAAALATILWLPLGLPSQLVRNAVPSAVVCGGGSNAPTRDLCTFGVASLALVVPILLMLAAFWYRRVIMAAVTRYQRTLPRGIGFLILPLVAALLFTIGWAGSHLTTGANVGLLPQTAFPGLVGLITFGVARWGPGAQRRLGPLFDRRDRYPVQIRFALTILVPLVLSAIVMAQDRTHAALKEQLLVVFGMAFGFVLLMPRRAIPRDHGAVRAGAPVTPR